MRVHLIKKQSVEDFTLKNTGSRSSFNTWLSSIMRVDWNEPNEMVLTFNSVDILGKSSNRVVFNVGGNNYRMICKYHFGKSKVSCLLNELVFMRPIQNYAVKENNTM